MMNFNPIQTLNQNKRVIGCLCVGMYSDKSLEYLAPDYKFLTENGVQTIIDDEHFNGELAQTLWIPLSKHKSIKSVLLVGLGSFKDFTLKEYVKTLGSTVTSLQKYSIKNVGFALCRQHFASIDTAVVLQHTAQKFMQYDYDFFTEVERKDIATYADRSTKNTEKKSARNDLNVYCLIPENDFSIKLAKQALSLGKALGQGVNTARYLGDLPANVCTPTYLAEFATQFAQEYSSIKIRVKEEKELAKLGMNVLLSVSQGSEQPAKFIEIEYGKSTAKESDTIVLVGKGVTFDTGGISIKPAGGMDEMKYDMCGAATVLGIMRFLAESKLSCAKVVGIIPATENMPSGQATKPGDVFKSYSGQTVEILNTDAEGRLILADSLSYAEKIYQPKKMVDIATLTGACVIALGHHRCAVMANDQSLVGELLESGDVAGDPCWQLPLDDEYDELLSSNFADMANVAGRAAGSVTAGCFLKRFVKKTAWAHLDIAGVAWLEGKKKGATGRPVSLLGYWLLAQST